MSAVAGVYYPATPKPVEPARIAAMTDAQGHRGPDGRGLWTAPGIGLGHRRLSIIDLAGSPQPMTGGALTVSYNGEIYNFAELRAELESKGARFVTAGDTEVLLHGWRAWGADLLDRLNGVFAFALHDADRNCLFLARDRFGVKPLHYVELSDGGLAFASELKGLLAHPLLRHEVSSTAIEDYMALGYVPDDACIVVGVRKLPAGHFLLVERRRPIPQPRQWWDLDFSNRAQGNTRDLRVDLIDRMRTAVRSQMVADVPLGAFLSGGVNSSAVVAMMAEASPRAVKTCTIGFDAAGPDQGEPAAVVARRFATEHRARTVASDDMALIDTLVAAFDEPFADASALVAGPLCRFAREQVTVALSGAGGDEVFAGHRRYRVHAAPGWLRRLTPAGLRGDSADAYAAAAVITPPNVRDQLYAASFRRSLAGHRGEARIAATMRDAPARSGLDAAQYADFKHWLPGDVLIKADRMSMAVGLEARVPWLDHHLVEFCATLPPSLRIRGGQGKWLMRRALEPWLPKDILYRPKKASAPAVGAWFRTGLAGDAAMLAKSPVLATWLDRTAIERLAEDHRTGRGEHGRTLWQLLMLEKAVARLFA